MEIKIPEDLEKQIKAFDHDHQFLRDPKSSLWHCVFAAEDFADRIPGAKVLHLLGNRVPYPRRLDGYPFVDDDYYHCVCLIDDLVIDWCRRPLDPKCRHPYVQHVVDLHKEWLKISEKLSEII